jgi:hypothetical protein
MLELLRETNVVVGKPPGSTLNTSVTQAANMGNVFKAAKTAIKSITKIFDEHYAKRTTADKINYSIKRWEYTAFYVYS